MPSKLRDFGNGKIIERDFSLMLELAQYKRRFEFMLPKGQFRGKYSKITKNSSISYKTVSIFKFKPAINTLNLILFQTTCSLIRMYYNAWKRDTLQVLGKSLKLSQPQTGGWGGGGCPPIYK